MSTMESSVTSVPYALSDIQLPKSPGDISQQESKPKENSSDVSSKLRTLGNKANGVESEVYHSDNLPPESKESVDSISVAKEGSKSSLISAKHNSPISGNESDCDRSIESKDPRKGSSQMIESQASNRQSEDEICRPEDSGSRRDSKKRHKHSSRATRDSKSKDNRAKSSDRNSSEDDRESKAVESKSKRKKLKRDNPAHNEQIQSSSSSSKRSRKFHSGDREAKISDSEPTKRLSKRDRKSNSADREAKISDSEPIKRSSKQDRKSNSTDREAKLSDSEPMKRSSKRGRKSNSAEKEDKSFGSRSEKGLNIGDNPTEKSQSLSEVREGPEISRKVEEQAVNQDDSKDSPSLHSDPESDRTNAETSLESRQQRKASVSPSHHSSSSSRSEDSAYEKHRKSSKSSSKASLETGGSDQTRLAGISQSSRKITKIVIDSSPKEKAEIRGLDQTQLDGNSPSGKKITKPSGEKEPDFSEAPRRRIKIKRDRCPIEVESKPEVTPKPIQESNAESSPILPPKLENDTVEESLCDVPYVSRKVSLSNRKKSQPATDTEPMQKKSKWGSFASKKAAGTVSISTDSLKSWFPEFKLISEPTPAAMMVEPDDANLPEDKPQPQHIEHLSSIEAENDTDSKAASTYTEVETESQEPVLEELSEQGPVSRMIFIKNLVRPFTLNQLKTLLKQFGNFVEESFWIDKIKSKCFVTYETEKEALKAKKALHNSRWPSSNPKILSVEFSNEEELELQKKGGEPPKPAPVPVVAEFSESVRVKEEPKRERERHRGERERERSRPQPPMREWDKDKIVQESPKRESLDRGDKRSSEKKDKKDSKKKASDDSSAKLLDDLFFKTKSTPCIYWLPLSEERVLQKEEEQKQKKLEREKRLEQIKQEETDRRNRRVRSPRRSREKENRSSATRSRSPLSRRR